MTETGSGLTPATSVAGVGLKQGFLWSEQTMNDYSENTIMREIRLGVVSCGDPVPLPEAFDGNIDVLWECNDPIGPNHTVIHVVTKLQWVHHPTLHGYYDSQGTYNFDYTITYPGCTEKKSATGSVGASGTLIIIDDPYSQNQLGYGYIA